MLIVLEGWYLIPTHRKERLGFVKEVNVLSPTGVGIRNRNIKIGVNEVWTEMSVCEGIRRNSKARIKRITCTDNKDTSDSSQACKHQGIICSHQAQKAWTPPSPERRWLDSRRPALWPQEDGSKAQSLRAYLTNWQAIVVRCPKQGNKINGEQTSPEIHGEYSEQYCKARACPIVTAGS